MAVLDLRVHLQDDPTACGLACAQMVLRYLSGTLHDQAALTPNAKDGAWQVSPKQLCVMLNNHLSGTGSQPKYKVFATLIADKAMERVVAAVNVGYPAIVLVGSQEHWVVVHGVTLSAAPTIHIRNPLPDLADVLSGPPPPPHTDTDVCKDEDITEAETFGGETATCKEWGIYHLVQASHAPVKNKYVVLAPSVPLTAGGLYSCVAPQRISGPAPRHLPDAAWKALSATNLLEVAEWNNLRLGPVADRWWHVRVSGDGGHRKETAPYHLVYIETDSPPGSKRKTASVLVRISENGAFLGAVLQPSRRLVKGLQSPPPLPPGLRPTSMAPGQVEWVWRFSRETLFSPFMPMARVQTPGGPKYWRPLDGRWFDRLT